MWDATYASREPEGDINPPAFHTKGKQETTFDWKD